MMKNMQRIDNTELTAFPPTDLCTECSIIEIECDPADYSASAIARAVEDSDAHLTGLSISPAEGKTKVTLQVTLRNPQPAVRSLERYGYRVLTAESSLSPDETLAGERLSALRAYLKV